MERGVERLLGGALWHDRARRLSYDGAMRQHLMRVVGLACVLAASCGPFELSKDGVRDPARGTRYSPVYPEVPVTGSPLEALMQALGGLHVETAFDPEPRAEGGSLRAVFELSRPASTGASAHTQRN